MNLHRFEPARLLLGLLLMGAAAAYVMDALGEWQLPAWARLVMVPASLLAAAFTAAATFGVRRILRRRRTQSPGDGDGFGDERAGRPGPGGSGGGPGTE